MHPDRWTIGGIAVGLVAALLGFLGRPQPPSLGGPTTGDPDVVAQVRAAVDDPEGYRGLAVALIERDRVRIAGLGDRGDRGGSPVDGDTAFEIGSVAKALTGMLLADMGKTGAVRPEDTLKACLPAVSGPAGDVTLVELTSHRAGLPSVPIGSAGEAFRLYVTDLRA